MHSDWQEFLEKMAVCIAVVVALVFLVPQADAFYTKMPASIVIGQTDFISGSANQGGSPDANTLRTSGDKGSLTYDPASGKLIVADGGNNRVLIFNRIPTINDASADVVIGQPNFTANAANQGGSPAANTLNNPTGVTVAGEKLLISDWSNNRVLIFNKIPTTNDASADVVIGQPDFTSNGLNQGAGFLNCKAYTLAQPWSTMVYENRLYISDENNRRVLIYNSIPNVNNTSADHVIGKPGLTTCSSPNSGSSGIIAPRNTLIVDSKLLLSDTNNHRVLIFNSIPTTDGASADVEIGQPNFTTGSYPDSSYPVEKRVAKPSGLAWDGKRLFISSDWIDDISIFNGVPTSNYASADILLGSPNFGESTPITADSLSNQTGIAVTENSLITLDAARNRILIYLNQLPDVSLSRTITGQPNGLLRFSGTASTSVPNQHIVRVEYSVNGSTWTGGFPLDGRFDSATEDYYFDFDPTINEMADQQGYTIKIRSTHDNDIDTSKAALYFQPFLTNAPANNSFTLNRLPSFTFTIQKQRFSDLKENLDHFRVMVKPEGSDWQPYIDNIPVDYNSVRLATDNLRPNQVDTMNGTYEDKFKTVTYDQDNSVITAQAKAVDSQGNESDKYWGDGGRLLNNATYQWKVQAEDHEGQFEDTDPQTLRIGTRQVVTSRPFFPLSIYAISGIPGYMDISTSHPDDMPQILNITAPTAKFAPTFAGIATAGSTVSFTITDDPQSTSSACVDVPFLPCSSIYETTVKPDSTFRITVPKAFKPGNSYDVTASVKDMGDNYNELPTFTVQVAAL